MDASSRPCTGQTGVEIPVGVDRWRTKSGGRASSYLLHANDPGQKVKPQTQPPRIDVSPTYSLLVSCDTAGRLRVAAVV